MYNNYPFYPYTSPQPVQTGFRVFPVASIEEAKSCQVDFQGNPLYFHNKTEEEVYCKKFNADTGVVDFKKYIKAEEPLKNAPISADTSKLEEEIEQIKTQIEELSAMIQSKGKKEAKDNVLQ